MNEDTYGFATGTTDGSGVVDMGDGLHVSSDEIKTIRLPDEHGGHWTVVLDKMEYSDGTLYLLAGDVSVFSGMGTQLWLRTSQIERFFKEGEE